MRDTLTSKTVNQYSIGTPIHNIIPGIVEPSPRFSLEAAVVAGDEERILFEASLLLSDTELITFPHRSASLYGDMIVKQNHMVSLQEQAVEGALKRMFGFSYHGLRRRLQNKTTTTFYATPEYVAHMVSSITHPGQRGFVEIIQAQ